MCCQLGRLWHCTTTGWKPAKLDGRGHPCLAAVQCCEDWSLHPVQKWLACGFGFAISRLVMQPFGVVNGGLCAALFLDVSGWHAASMADMENALRNLLDIAGTAQLELGGGPRNPFHPLVLCCRFFGRKCVNSCCFLVGCTGLQKPIARCECFSSGCMKVGRQKANSTCPL